MPGRRPTLARLIGLGSVRCSRTRWWPSTRPRRRPTASTTTRWPASLGFRGGLVPGVDVYAYRDPGPRAGVGEGVARTRDDRRPVPPPRLRRRGRGGGRGPGAARRSAALVLSGPGGKVCAWAAGRAPGDRLPPSTWVAWPGRGAPRRPRGHASSPWRPARRSGWRAHVPRRPGAATTWTPSGRCTRCTACEGIAHPGWILRDANYVLSANVRLGPWIHVSSPVRHLGPRPRRRGDVRPGRSSPRSGSKGPPLRPPRRAPPGRRPARGPHRPRGDLPPPGDSRLERTTAAPEEPVGRCFGGAATAAWSSLSAGSNTLPAASVRLVLPGGTMVAGYCSEPVGAGAQRSGDRW